jgi:outer membrane protein OmpA-like peptidoglycan-associated protein
MNLRYALAAATILAVPAVAKAQAIEGLYVGAGAGINILQDEKATITRPGTAISTDLKSRLGPAAVVSLGYGFGYGLRAELEGNYRYNSFNGGSNGTNIGGKEQKFGAMVNVLYDFVGLTPYVTPYVGVGAGYAWAQEDNLHGTFGALTATTATKTKGAFAYQGIVGAAFPITGAPGLAVTAEYRFFGMKGDRNYPTTVGGVAGNTRLDADYNHSVLLGVRYAFNAAPPAPAAAPAPVPVQAQAPARSYLVFFDWDKATLTDRARQIISEAAASSTKVSYTRIEVNGYTDTSGTPKYNQGLSVRRAQAVAAELVKDGVPKSAISIQGFGESNPLVPTGPGVREPQNRRVEIIIR